MGEKAKVVALVLIILMLVALSLAGGIFYLFQKEQAINATLQREKEELGLNIKITQTKLDESQKEVARLGLKLSEAQTQLESLTSDLEQEKNSKTEAFTQIQQLKGDLEKQKGLKADLENKLKQAENDLAQMRSKLNDLESKKAELEIKVKDLEEQAKKAEVEVKDVELGTIVVTPDAPASVEAGQVSDPSSDSAEEGKQVSSSGLTGKVLVINKEYNFAVINLGTADNINIGDIFSVYHNDAYIGDLKIEKIHDSMSAAGFVSAEIKNSISEGDKVVQQIK